jgi:putative ABC transport system ATP-binding protein
MFPGTIKENIAYALKLHNKENETIINKSIQDAGLSTHFLLKNAETLSGGEKKRVALARALALEPNILLLDEPTNGVDPKNIQTVEQNIITFTNQRNLTVIWVTHNIDQAKRVSHRIANLKNGTITTVQQTKDFKWEVAY